MDLILILLKLLVILMGVIFLIVFSLKLSSAKLENFQKGKYIKILEKTQLSKDNSLYVVKFGERGCVISSSNGKVEILQNLTVEEIELLELERAKANEEILNKYNYFIERLKNKLNIKKQKEERNEKEK
jgi:flagellar protein FliO/FliZ